MTTDLIDEHENIEYVSREFFWKTKTIFDRFKKAELYAVTIINSWLAFFIFLLVL